MSPSKTPLVSRYTFQLHARAALLEGLLTGVLVTSDVVARKSLNASQFQITVLTMAPSASQILAIVLARRFEHLGQKRLFFWAGLLGRLSLLGMALVFGPWPFLAILLVGAVVQTVVIPAQNAVYQANYKPEIRGRLFGRAQVFAGVATAVAALIGGFLLDHDPGAYRWLYPIAGIAGFGAALVFGSIRLRRSGLSAPAVDAADSPGGPEGPDSAESTADRLAAFPGSMPPAGSREPPPPHIGAPAPAVAPAPSSAAAPALSPETSPSATLATPATPATSHAPSPTAAPPRPGGSLHRLLFEDAPFRRFETAMFVYGLGYMTMQPVFARLFVDELHMSYGDASLAKGVVFSAVPVVALSFAGRMHDRIGLERLATRAYVVLALFAAWMSIVATPAQVVAGFALYGLGMAGVNISWSMGPLKYAPPGQASRYMGVHVGLVGVRAMIGYPLGGMLAEHFGSSRPTFALSAAFFSVATVLMMRAERIAGAAAALAAATAAVPLGNRPSPEGPR